MKTDEEISSLLFILIHDDGDRERSRVDSSHVSGRRTSEVRNVQPEDRQTARWVAKPHLLTRKQYDMIHSYR